MAAVESDALSYQVVGKRPTRPDGVEKVTGRARYGADAFAPGMHIGKVLRSPYPHARVRSIDASKALALPGVKAVVTRADFADASDDPPMHDTLCNLMADDKVLYEGHAVAAVAASSNAVARRALALIKVDYEPLGHVTDVDAAMRDDAPLLHDNLFTAGVEPRPEKPSNVAGYYEVKLGDVDRGFAAADGRGEVWCCTQGHFDVRNMCA